MKHLLLQLTSDSLSVSKLPFVNAISWWVYLVVSGLFVILILARYLIKKYKKQSLQGYPIDKIKAMQKTSVDLDNLMYSISSANELYKDLSKTCHPDRFLKDDKHSIAEEIFKEITKSKRNYAQLDQLKKRAEAELDIQFKSTSNG